MELIEWRCQISKSWKYERSLGILYASTLDILVLSVISSNKIIPAGLTLCRTKQISNIAVYIKYAINGFLRDIFIARKDNVFCYNKSSLYIVGSLRKWYISISVRGLKYESVWLFSWTILKIPWVFFFFFFSYKL